MKRFLESIKKDDKKTILSLFAILSVILLTVAGSYAFFSYSKLGLGENTIQTGSIKFIYNESDRVGNGISLTDAMPMSDEVGKTQDKYFDFSVTGTSGTAKLNYEITARKVTGSDNLDQYVKLYLTKVNGSSEQQKALAIYNDLSDSTNQLAQNHTEKVLYRGAIPAGATDYTENYRLRMWLNYDANDGNILNYTQTETGVCSDTTYTTEADCVAAHKDWTRTATSMAEKIFTVKVNVYANGEMATQQEIADANTATIDGVVVNGNNATLNQDTSKNYDYSINVPYDVSSVDVVVDGKVDNQSATVESITAAEATNLKTVSTSISVPVSEGDNYFKITNYSPNKENSEIYILKVYRALDVIATPVITSKTVYPTLTYTGVTYGKGLTVTYDTRSDITNYISFNGGTTWEEYTGNNNITGLNVVAKSVKNGSTTQASASKTLSVAGDAIGGAAFDSDPNSAAAYDTVRKFYIDSSLWGKQIRVLSKRDPKNNFPMTGYADIYYTNTSSTTRYTIFTKTSTVNTFDYVTISISTNASYILFTGNTVNVSHSGLVYDVAVVK